MELPPDKETIAREAIRITLRTFSEEVATMAERIASDPKMARVPAPVALRAFAATARRLAVDLWGKDVT